jgi:hypothetical protein
MKMKMGPIQKTVEKTNDDDCMLRSQVFIKGEYEGLTPTCDV